MSRLERIKTAPSHYPPVPFHIIRTAQLISSAYVFSVMCYFIWWLIHDRYPIPWTFILLCSIWTVSPIPPLPPLPDGVYYDAIGQLYERRAILTLHPSVSTLLAFGLDMYVRQRSTRRGVYHNMSPIDAKRSVNADAYPVPSTAASATNPFSDPPNPFSDHNAMPRQSSPAAAGHESPYANRMPSPYLQSPNDPEQGGFSHGAHAGAGANGAEVDNTKSPMEYLKGPFARQQRPEKGGYEVPDEQFKYDDDTEYRGGHHGAA
ncbi:MAG: hypothetical protein Q9157_005771 [Trypethelium eluteriae]